MGQAGTALVLLALVVVAAPPGMSQNEVVALFGDSARTDCYAWVDEGYGVGGYYVFHYSASGATGSRFLLPHMACLFDVEGPYLHYSPHAYVGRPSVGIQFEYGTCLTGWIFVAELWYVDSSGFGFPFCCEQPVLAHPYASSGEPEAHDCAGAWKIVEGNSGFMIGDPSCPCSTPTGILSEMTTWGRIKATFFEDGIN